MQFITNRKWNDLQQQMKAMQTQGLASMVNNFTTKIFPSWTVVKEMDAYQNVNQVYSVIRKLATCSAIVPFYGYTQEGEDLPDSDPLVTFLGTLDFEEKEKMYTQYYLFAEVFGFKDKIELGVNSGKINRLIFQHPNRMVPLISNSFPRQIVGFKYFEVETGLQKDMELEDVMFVKTYNPSTDPNKEFRGLSAVSVLARVITRIKSAEDASVGQLQNGGTPGIVYNKTPGVAIETTGQRKDSFGRFIRNSDNKGAPYFAGDELGYIQLGTPLTDMEVNEMASIDFDGVCNAFGVSSVLFNNKSASTESNVREMLAEMYENTIIPNLVRFQDALNKSVVHDIKTKGVIKCDTSEIKALQEDQTKLVNALAAAWWLTPNEKRTAQMYDQADDELMDKYLVPANLVPIDDLSMVQPIDNAAGDYVAPADANKNPKVVPLKTGTNG